MNEPVKKPEITAPGRTLRVWDPIERSSLEFDVPASVGPTPTSTEPFHYPVDVAAEIETSRLDCNVIRTIHVLTDEGASVADSANGDTVRLPDGAYLIDVSAPMKCYVRVDSPVHIQAVDNRTRIEFAERTSVCIGVRSMHDRPAATITIDDEPASLGTALSYFGDTLYTQSPGRSFPTLRGHPPRLKYGTHLDIPDGLDRPDSGICLELPPEPEYLFPAASLAYYLAATVTPGPEPRLHVGDRTVALGRRGDGYERTVARALKRVFFLDCLTRTERYYQTALYEREQFEGRLAASPDGPDRLEFDSLFDLPPARRIDRYFDVPFEVIEPLVPAWRVTADVQPELEYAEVLPYLVSDLAMIRCPEVSPVADPPTTPAEARDFFRDGDLETDELSFVDLPSADSLEHVFVGDASPIRASKTPVEAFEAKLDRVESRSDDLSIAIVLNDQRMYGECEAVRACYRALEAAGAQVTVLEDIGVLALENVLTEDYDFFHYIGHVTARGIECSNGAFDTTTGDGYEIDSFILNGCRSYRQGEGLVDGGAVAGVVTTAEVANEPAVDVGANFARLLSDGFPIRPAKEIATRTDRTGRSYLVIGDGGFRIADQENAASIACSLSNLGDGSYELTIETYPTDDANVGGFFTPHIDGVDHQYLVSGVIDTVTVGIDELEPFLTTSFPVEYEGELVWSDELWPHLLKTNRSLGTRA